MTILGCKFNLKTMSVSLVLYSFLLLPAVSQAKIEIGLDEQLTFKVSNVQSESKDLISIQVVASHVTKEKLPSDEVMTRYCFSSMINGIFRAKHMQKDAVLMSFDQVKTEKGPAAITLFKDVINPLSMGINYRGWSPVKASIAVRNSRELAKMTLSVAEVDLSETTYSYQSNKYSKSVICSSQGFRTTMTGVVVEELTGRN